MTERFDPARGTTYNLLFVCTGNTCRSPMAAAIARAEIDKRGWQHVTVRSAGSAASPGQPASEQTLKVLAAHGIEPIDHSTTPLDEELVRSSDLILTMSPTHLYAVSELGGAEKVALITDFLEGEESGETVEDPFGGDEAAYERTYQQLSRAIDSLLGRLEPILSP